MHGTALRPGHIHATVYHGTLQAVSRVSRADNMVLICIKRIPCPCSRHATRRPVRVPGASD